MRGKNTNLASLLGMPGNGGTWGKRSTAWMIFWVLVGLLSLWLLYDNFGRKYHLSSYSYVTQRKFLHENYPMDLPGLAIATVSITTDKNGEDDDDTDFQQWAHLSVRSLRKNGHFEGPVYLLTNKPEYHKQMKTEATIIDVSKMMMTSENWLKPAMSAKIFKTKILDLIPVQPAYLLFMDADVLVRAPLTVFFYDIILPLQKYDAIFSRTRYAVHGADNEERYHSAVFIMRTSKLQGKAEEILELWRAQLLDKEHSYARDQTALLHAVIKNGLEDNIFVGQRTEWVYYPKDDGFDLSKLWNAPETKPFVHITTSALDQLNSQKVLDCIHIGLNLETDNLPNLGLF